MAEQFVAALCAGRIGSVLVDPGPRPRAAATQARSAAGSVPHATLGVDPYRVRYFRRSARGGIVLSRPAVPCPRTQNEPRLECSPYSSRLHRTARFSVGVW